MVSKKKSATKKKSKKSTSKKRPSVKKSKKPAAKKKSASNSAKKTMTCKICKEDKPLINNKLFLSECCEDCIYGRVTKNEE